MTAITILQEGVPAHQRREDPRNFSMEQPPIALATPKGDVHIRAAGQIIVPCVRAVGVRRGTFGQPGPAAARRRHVHRVLRPIGSLLRGRLLVREPASGVCTPPGFLCLGPGFFRSPHFLHPNPLSLLAHLFLVGARRWRRGSLLGLLLGAGDPLLDRAGRLLLLLLLLLLLWRAGLNCRSRAVCRAWPSLDTSSHVA